MQKPRNPQPRPQPKPRRVSSYDLDPEQLVICPRCKRHDHVEQIQQFKMCVRCVEETDVVFLDTETTGLDPSDGAEIIEIAIVDYRGKTLINSLVKPVKNDAWPEAQKINGISPEMVENAPPLDELLPAIRDACRGCRVVIYNADFDTRFFPENFFGSLPCRTECCMLQFAEHVGEWNEERQSFRWHKLTAAAKVAGHKWRGDAHRALADAKATRTVWRWLQKQKRETENSAT